MRSSAGAIVPPAVFILSEHDAGVRRLQAAPTSDVAKRWLLAIGEGRCIHDRRNIASDDVVSARCTAGESRRTCAGDLSPGRNDSLGHRGRACRCAHHRCGHGRRPADVDRPADGSSGSRGPPSFSPGPLQASCTTEVGLTDVKIDDSELLSGPAVDILSIPMRGSARPDWRPRPSRWARGGRRLAALCRAGSGSDRSGRAARRPLRKLAVLLGAS